MTNSPAQLSLSEDITISNVNKHKGRGGREEGQVRVQREGQVRQEGPEGHGEVGQDAQQEKQSQHKPGKPSGKPDIRTMVSLWISVIRFWVLGPVFLVLLKYFIVL